MRGALLFKYSRKSYFPPILNIVVPQTSQTAFVAILPFFMVTACASLPSLFARHFTQYIINNHPRSLGQNIVYIFYLEHFNS